MGLMMMVWMESRGGVPYITNIGEEASPALLTYLLQNYLLVDSHKLKTQACLLGSGSELFQMPANTYR